MALDIDQIIENLHMQMETFNTLVTGVSEGNYETKHSIKVSLAQIDSWDLENILNGLRDFVETEPEQIKALINNYDGIDVRLTKSLQKLSLEQLIDFWIKDLDKKLRRYEQRVEFVDQAEYEVNLDTLMVRDGIDFLLHQLSGLIDITSYQQRVIIADRVFKQNYNRNPENLDSFTIKHRERTFKPETLWWWYMDQDVTTNS